MSMDDDVHRVRLHSNEWSLHLQFYECSRCHHVLIYNLLHSHRAHPPKRCPSCRFKGEWKFLGRMETEPIDVERRGLGNPAY